MAAGLSNIPAAFVFTTGVAALPVPSLIEKSVSTNRSRECMTTIVDQVLASILAHSPDRLPLASVYYATESSDPSALGMMTLWRTITSAGSPSLLAVDTTSGSAYFALDISQGLVENQITQLGLYVTHSHGVHGFSFSAEELPDIYERWIATTFNPNGTLSVTIADDCQFTEEGWRMIEPGPERNGSTTPRWSCGIFVTGAITPGKVYSYGDILAFIPDDMQDAQEGQDKWLAKTLASGDLSLLSPTAATGETYKNAFDKCLPLPARILGPPK
ncbi:hypothetical protein BDV38DRAFT_276271 [Aspergillus pseudotamarii]|uniref:Uncharacterized protein n=1 Tax=Aspergillus pseudotamarii TaxID=132259 RepID=A0A5N6SCE6_ASPPS|nr:uncharacterized protein BDV38DRAFT_276271 [Aspergillus pseudotamarii]KAE8131063.1 hypothetical protein BDV38DRAFT_276271 [Aspergillus pseudotamarii]